MKNKKYNWIMFILSYLMIATFANLGTHYLYGEYDVLTVVIDIIIGIIFFCFWILYPNKEEK